MYLTYDETRTQVDTPAGWSFRLVHNPLEQPAFALYAGRTGSGEVRGPFRYDTLQAAKQDAEVVAYMCGGMPAALAMTGAMKHLFV